MSRFLLLGGTHSGEWHHVERDAYDYRVLGDPPPIRIMRHREETIPMVDPLPITRYLRGRVSLPHLEEEVPVLYDEFQDRDVALETHMMHMLAPRDDPPKNKVQQKPAVARRGQDGIIIHFGGRSVEWSLPSEQSILILQTLVQVLGPGREI